MEQELNARQEAQALKIAMGAATELFQRHSRQVRLETFKAILPAIVDEVARQLAGQGALVPVHVEIHTPSGRRTKRVKGPHHRLLPQIIKMASSRTSDGFPPPLWLYGPPGTGKGVMAKQVAEALDVPFYPVPLGPTSSESNLLGYKNLLAGAFVTGQVYEPFMRGGLAFLDEVDAADPGVLVGTNSLISNDRFRFPDGETVERHPDFYLLAAGNTIGTGGTSGFTRNKLDAAFLDRFVKIRVDFDEDLEAAICDNRPWVTYVQNVRRHLERSTLGTFYITTRAILNGAALLAAGIPASIVVETVLLPGCSEAIRRDVRNEIGDFKK